MISTPEHNECVAKMTFAFVYPYYKNNVETIGKTTEELARGCKK